MLVLNRSSIEIQAGIFSTWWENKEKKDTFLRAENEKHLKEYKEMEKQMEVMKEYMEKQGIRTREAARSDRKKSEQER